MTFLFYAVAYGIVAGLTNYALYLLSESDWDDPWADPVWILAMVWPVMVVAGPMMLAARLAKRERGSRT